MSYGNKRDEWTFEYSAEEITQAAAEKAKYHSDREQHWRKERDKAEAELREKGIEFREHEVTGGKNVQAVIDPERQAHLNACSSKIETHRRQRDEYQGFADVLAREFDRNPSARFPLTTGDVLHFGLA